MMHHAQVLYGRKEWALTQLPEDARESLDCEHIVTDRMNLADAQALVVSATRAPIIGERRTFVIVAETILREAQNALLKLFEDPTGGAVFYLVVPRQDTLLPTLASRLHVLGKEEGLPAHEDFVVFQKASYADRLQMIGDHSDDEDNTWFLRVVQGTELHAREAGDPRLIEEVMYVASMLPFHGSSRKMLLEHLALSF